MTANAVGRRSRRAAAAVAASALLSVVPLIGPVSARTVGTVSPADGIRALRAAAASATVPSGVDRVVYQAAIEAYVWGSPLVITNRTLAVLGCAVSTNTFLDQPGLAGPTSRLVVTPNTDTLYSSAWLDLRAGPVVLRLPALGDHYYVFQFLDAHTNTIANVGTRTTGQGPASYAVTGPGWRGRLPAGTRQIEAPTPDVWVIGRTLPKDAADVATVVALQRQYSLEPLAGAAPSDSGRGRCGGPGPEALNASGAQLFDELGVALAADPPPASDAPVLRDLAAAGIGPGKQPSRNADPMVVAALTQGVSAAHAVIARTAAQNLVKVGGWSRLQHIGAYGSDYLTRAAVAETSLGANVPAESVYYATGTDLAGAALIGARAEIVHFAAGQLPPLEHHGFWSVTLYGPDHFLVPNPLDRYAIGDRTTGLQRGADGSLDVYLGFQAPAGHEANWLPAPPGAFSLVLRAYLPGAAIRSGAWRPPPIRPLAP